LKGINTIWFYYGFLIPRPLAAGSFRLNRVQGLPWGLIPFILYGWKLILKGKEMFSEEKMDEGISRHFSTSPNTKPSRAVRAILGISSPSFSLQDRKSTPVPIFHKEWVANHYLPVPYFNLYPLKVKKNFVASISSIVYLLFWFLG